MKATYQDNLIIINLEEGDEPISDLSDIMEYAFPNHNHWTLFPDHMIISNDIPYAYDDEDKEEFEFNEDNMPQNSDDLYLFPDAKFWCPKNPKTAIQELNSTGKLIFYPFEFIVIDELPIRVFKSDEDVYDPFTIVLCDTLARKKEHYDPYFDYVYSSSELGSYSYLGEIGYDRINICKGNYTYGTHLGREINGKDLDKFISEYPKLFETIKYLVKENLPH